MVGGEGPRQPSCYDLTVRFSGLPAGADEGPCAGPRGEHQSPIATPSRLPSAPPKYPSGVFTIAWMPEFMSTTRT